MTCPLCGGTHNLSKCRRWRTNLNIQGYLHTPG